MAALGLRVGYVLGPQRDAELPGDGFYYHHAANLLADGKGFIDPARYRLGGAQELFFYGEEHIERSAATELPVGHREPTAGHPPAWTVLLAAASLAGIRSVLGHQLVGALTGAAGVVCVGILGREVRSCWPGSRDQAERVGLVAAAIAAAYAFLWLNDGMIMSESLVVGLVALATVAGIRFARHPTFAHAAMLGALGALAALTRAELALFVPLVAVWVLARSSLRWRRRVAVAGLTAAVSLVVVAPWVVRNSVAFGRPVLLSNGLGTVLVQANCDATYYGDKLGYWELLCGLPQPLGPGGEPLDEAQRDAVLRDRALEYISDHKARLVTVVIPARIGRMWAVYDPVQQLRFDILVQSRNFRLSVLGLVQYAVLVPAAIAGAIHIGRHRGVLAPLLAWPVVTTATAVVAFGETRYRVSSEVVIVTLASVAAVGAAEWWQRRSRAPERERATSGPAGSCRGPT